MLAEWALSEGSAASEEWYKSCFPLYPCDMG